MKWLWILGGIAGVVFLTWMLSNWYFEAEANKLCVQTTEGQHCWRNEIKQENY